MRFWEGTGSGEARLAGWDIEPPRAVAGQQNFGESALEADFRRIDSAELRLREHFPFVLLVETQHDQHGQHFHCVVAVPQMVAGWLGMQCWEGSRGLELG